MSCSTPKLLSFYTNKVNIYKSDCFIPLPTWRSCPAPPMVIIGPTCVVPGPCGEPTVKQVQQPLFYPGQLCTSCYKTACSC
jgi:hypothetical protein